MSEETQIDEAIKLAEEAQSKKVFSLADAIKGRAYPKTEVNIYLDDESAMEIVRLKQDLNATFDPDEIKEIEDKILVFAEKIKESSLVFHMRGLSQRKVEEVIADCNKTHNIKDGDLGTENSDWLKDYIMILVGLNIEKVVDFAGNVDDSAFTLDKVSELRTALPVSEWTKLVEAMQKLTLAGGYFDQVVDAGFLQKS